MRFVGALEELLDPIVAILDALPAHFDPDHAPRDILDLLGAWLGVDLDESQALPSSARWCAAPPSSAAGAAPSRGLELALQLPFPDVPLRVEDKRRRHAGRPTNEPGSAAPASFIVYCDKPVPEETQAAIARCIEQYKPVHTAYRLRVKAPKKTGRVR